MEMPRHDPDQLLEAIRKEDRRKSFGKLKIFFGYAAGTGKTFAMLQAAHQACRRGVDVVAGYIEPHARPQTAALMSGLEQIAVKKVPYQNMTLSEFDIDQALRRRPQLILVDELAHTNAPGSRHMKRHQDVQELLKAGIDVYTTVNVQHIESLNDMVASITGIQVQERIPDSVFDQADHVELVDIEPAELLERMEAGNIYRKEQAERAALHFFTDENLTALREIALRRCADRVNLRMETARIQSRKEYHTDEHILVCLSSSPSNAKIIRTAARMAQAFRSGFTALFVESTAAEAMGADDRNRLRSNIRLAGQLGACVETVYGEDIAQQIAEFATLSGVSKIVIGRSAATRNRLFGKPALTDQLIACAPHIDIHVIPDSSAGMKSCRCTKKFTVMPHLLHDMICSILVLAICTVIGYVFFSMGFSEANIVAVYILGVLVISIVTTSRFCGAAASLVSVLVFVFFFTEPRFTFRFSDPNYIVTFVIMFLVALLTDSLASRLKNNARQSARAAYRTKILFETNQLLQKETREQAIADATAGQLVKLLNRDIVVYLADKNELKRGTIYRCAQSEKKNLVSENEKAVAFWVFRNNKHAGATTDTLSNACCLYLAIRIDQHVDGVVGIAMDETPLDCFENSIVLSILGECALALENIKNAREKEEAAVRAENERLRADLLRMISHDLRTPLTAISGNADNLLSSYRKMDETMREQTFSDIYDDSIWLIDLVENLLAITRIGEGKVQMSRCVHVMDEIVAEAVQHESRRCRHHTIRQAVSQDLLLVDADARLIIQVLVNLIENAIKYTPPGSVIEISSQPDLKNHQVVVSVADDGPGIPDEQKEHVFDMFYCNGGKTADSQRSLGLGLSLCRSIVEAHDGTITVADRKPQGTVFTFTLPAGEVQLHE